MRLSSQSSTGDKDKSQLMFEHQLHDYTKTMFYIEKTMYFLKIKALLYSY